MVQLSFGISGSKPLNEYIALAQTAEAYGFHTFSIFDDLMYKPAWPILFVVAQHTQRIRIGPSVCNPYLIHPAILAGNAALLDELSGGRAYMGIGRGAFLEFIEETSPKPITTVREAIAFMRRLWRGDSTPFTGEVFKATESATLTWTPTRAELPVMVGTWGAKMCRMAGGVADEVKAGSMWSAAYGRHMWAQIEAGAREAGRDPKAVGLVFGPLTAISEDRAQAKAYARRTLAFYLPYLAPMPAFVGMDAEAVARVAAATGSGDMDAALAEISDEVLDNFALYGTPQDVIAGIERMVSETAVTRVEFGMPHGPSGSMEALHLIGKHVLPHFARTNTQ
ncbi:MAG: LLM class flavin-dependent oxidoreductase [Chloroflexi bacterium]|nr:LLM class flavin-dependent oxidoreductase [Chloroflexota bacterium]